MPSTWSTNACGQSVIHRRRIPELSFDYSYDQELGNGPLAEGAKLLHLMADSKSCQAPRDADLSVPSVTCERVEAASYAAHA